MIDKFVQAIKSGESDNLLTKRDQTFTGFSGTKLVGSLQRLVSLFAFEENACYLEVGVFQGLTLLSAASINPSFPCYGIDNFAHHDPENKNYKIVKDRIDQLKLENVTIINRDYEDALENLGTYIGNRKIAVYFVDGPHDYRSQLMCLELAVPYLHSNAVIVVDDSNYRHVRQANRDFLITHPDYKLIFEAYTQCHPNNMAPSCQKEAREGWWNGVNILVRDTSQQLKPMYPPTERNRELYENEHIIHASNLAKFTPKALNLAQSVYEVNFYKFASSVIKLFVELRAFRNYNKNLYKSLNTHSEDLPSSNYNTSK